MPRSGKNNERIKQVPRGRKKTAKVEPLRQTTEQPNKLYNDLAKFPSENPYSVLRIHKDGTVLYANKASEPLLKARDIAIGKPAPQEWRRLVEEVLTTGQVAREEVKDDGRVFAFRVVPITGSDYVNFYGVDITEQKKAEERVKAERQRLYDVLETLPVMVCLLTPDYHVAFTNRVFREKFGEDNGRHCYDYIFGRKGPCEFCEAHNVLKTGKPHHWECTGPDGCSIIDVYDFPFTDTDGSPLILEMDIDITEQKRAEEMLKRERDNLSGIFEAMNDGVYIVNQQYDIQYVNRVLQEEYGHWKGIKCYTYFHDRTEICPWCPNQKVFAGETVHWEWYSEKNGKSYDLIDTPLKGPDGSILKLEIFRDITERKNMEEALHRNEARYRSSVELTGQLIWTTDSNGEVVEDIPLWRKFTGLSYEETKGSGWTKALHPEDAEHTRQVWDKAVKDKNAYEVEYRLRRFDGVYRNFLTRGIPVFKEDGSIQEWVGVNIDITERKKAEGTLLEYQKQLKRLAARLTLTEERERRRIAGKIHDEISQTLAIVKIKVDTLQSSSPSEASAAEIAEISSSVEKVIQETRTLTLELSYPILYELGFEAAVAEWLSEQVQKKHGIATEFQDDGQTKPLDDDVRVLLFRNVRELLINVIKHARAEKVKVRIERIDDSINVTVEDNGAGFAPAEAKVMTTKKTGFGLFSVRESLEELGGRFVIESKPGAGCKAIMTAPLKGKNRGKEG